MNAAIAMRPNACGQTVLGSEPQGRGEHIDVTETEECGDFQPHIGASGEFVHNQSVINSPTLKRFFENYAKNLEQTGESEEPVETPPTVQKMIDGEHASVTDLDSYAKEFEDTEESIAPALMVKQTETKARRVFASHSPVRFCTECGFSFSVEKFCPHCGTKRATYSAPNV